MIMKLKNILASAACIALLAGCTDALEYEPSIYLTEAQKSQTKTITVHQAGEKADFSVSASVVVNKDTHVTLEVVPELVETYNKLFGRESVLLDPQTYDFVKQEVTIKKGTNVSDNVELAMKTTLEPGKFYCLPVRIASTDGDMPILSVSSTIYLIFRAPVNSRGVYIGSSNKYIVPGFYGQDGTEGKADLTNLQELTLECRVKANAFTESDPYISSIMGLEGNMCLRFGDVKIGNNVLQICKADCQPAAVQAPCSTGNWYHVAGVWSRNSLRVYINGRLITEAVHAPNEGVDISLVHLWQNSGIGFGLGVASNYNGNRPLNGYLAEARIWTRALSSNEIANLNDLVVVDPQSEGLLAYWKMNESVSASEREKYSGWSIRNKIADQTGHGYDACGISGSPQFEEATW